MKRRMSSSRRVNMSDGFFSSEDVDDKAIRFTSNIYFVIVNWAKPSQTTSVIDHDLGSAPQMFCNVMDSFILEIAIVVIEKAIKLKVLYFALAFL